MPLKMPIDRPSAFSTGYSFGKEKIAFIVTEIAILFVFIRI
jgi:hypothetical protein